MEEQADIVVGGGGRMVCDVWGGRTAKELHEGRVKAAFLGAYAATGLKGVSARKAKTDLRRIKRWEAEDSEFRKGVAAAEEEYLDRLIKEADRRGVEGVEKWGWGKKGSAKNGDEKFVKLAMPREYSDKLLVRRLEALDRRYQRESRAGGEAGLASLRDGFLGAMLRAMTEKGVVVEPEAREVLAITEGEDVGKR